MDESVRNDLAAILAGTRAVDGDGRPLILCHATSREFEHFSVTTDLGFHFGTRKQAEKRMANMISRGEAQEYEPWRIITGALAIRCPLVIADDPGIWNPRWLTATLCSFLNAEDRERIRGLASEIESSRNEDAMPFLREVLSEWFSVLVGALKRAGHDGVVYRNVFENSGRSIEWSWLVFDDSQIVRLDTDASQALRTMTVGEPLRLRGARPMRHHQPYGIGRLMRARDRADFRRCVTEWAQAANIEWSKVYPSNYEPTFGEGRPSHDLEAKIGENAGYRIRVSSFTGVVLLQPFSAGETCDVLMKRFRSDASEGFFEQGSNQSCSEEMVSWRPAETLEVFLMRLEGVHYEFEAAFPANSTCPTVPERR